MRYRSFVALCICIPLWGCPALEQTLRLFDLTPLSRPHPALLPGALVWCSHGQPFRMGVLCEMDENFGPAFWPTLDIERSEALQRALSEPMQLESQLEAYVLDALGTAEAKRVSVRLQKSRLYRLPPELAQSQASARTADCAARVHAREAHGFIVTLVTQALVLDVTFVIDWHTALWSDGERRMAALHRLAEAFEGEATVVHNDAVFVRGLVWAISEDEHRASPNRPRAVL